MNLDNLMACRLCTIALNEYPGPDGTTYEHPVCQDEDHQPDPVPANEIMDVYLRCHLCSGKHPVWNYRTETIEVAAVGGTHDVRRQFSTQWHACHPCSQLIEDHDSDGLTERCINAVAWSPSSLSTQLLRSLHRTIVITREPTRTLLTTTDWPPANLMPDALPQIRDKLTSLLRGPAALPPPINDSTIREALAAGLDSGPMYWINQKSTDKVIAVTGSQPPAAITNRIVPTAHGLLAWPHPVGPHQPIAAVSWKPHNDGWHILCYRAIGNHLPKDSMAALRHDLGWLIPTHAEYVPTGMKTDGRHLLAPLVTTWLLIAQQLAEIVPAKVRSSDRKTRKRGRAKAPDVRLVRIKPTSHDHEPVPATTSGRTRAKPDHRYWVSAHERNQAYGPGRSLRQKIDIDPFLKGPEGLPIKLSTTVRVLGSSKPTPPKDKE